MATNLTIVLVPGAWHRAETWSKVTALLEKQHQYKCIAVSLPSTKSDPTATVKTDVDAVRSIIQTETHQGRNVVVVVHSYGGLLGQSAIQGLTRPSDLASSTTDTKPGFVIGLVIIASGFVVPANCFLDGLGGQAPPTWKLDYETGFLEIVGDARDMFYHDLPEDEAKEWVAKLTKHSLKTITEGGEHFYPGWKDVPAWFIATIQDKSLPIEAQRMFVQTAKDAGGDVTLRELDTSHSPMLSKPQETADIISEAVHAFVQ
jgi:pimeloyl-ACP methyl ester carboxylesterase